MNLALLLLLPAALAGAAALLLELAWLQRAGAVLPGTAPAAAVVVPAMLLAWALGSWVAGRRADLPAERLPRAARWLALAAVAVIAAPLGLAAAGDVVVGSIWTRALVGGLPAAPAAFALGGVLPWFTRLRHEGGRSPLGATTGCAAAVALGGALAGASYLPLVRAGLDGLQIAALLLAAAAVLTTTLGAWARQLPPPQVERAAKAPGDTLNASRAELFGWRLVLLLGGAALVGGQVLLLRVLAQTHGDNLLSTTLVLASVHLGMAVGAALLGRTTRFAASSRALPLLAVAAAAFWLPAWLTETPRAAVVLAGLALGLGAGCLLSACADVRRGAGDRLGSWVGDLGAASTLGGVLGGFVAGRVLLDASGPGTAFSLRYAPLLLLAAATPLLFLGGGRSVRRVLFALPLIVVALGSGRAWVPAWEAPWRVDSSDAELLLRREGAHGIVSLVRRADNSLRLSVDGRFGLGGDGSGALLEQRMGRIAAALAPEARRALALGIGRGHTLAGLASTSAAQVVAVERNADVLALDLGVPGLIGSDRPVASPKLIHADARAFLAASDTRYDLIVGDLFHPSALGAGAMLGQEQFTQLRSALSDEGVYVQWLPLHQLSWSAFGAVSRAFLDVFPSARALLATGLSDTPVLALVGGLAAGLPDAPALDQMLSASVCAAGPNTAVELYDLVLCDAWALERALGEGPMNTLAQPWSEWLSQGQLDVEDELAGHALRQLALLSVPLATSSLRDVPSEESVRRELARELTARSAVQQALLHARADMSLLDSDLLRRSSLEHLGDVETQLTGRLLGSWSTVPGHPDARVALLERSGELSRDGRLVDAASLLGEALRNGGDPALGAALGRLLLRLGRDADARLVLDQALALAPEEPALHLDVASVQLITQDDAGAVASLERARALAAPTPLPVPARLALALLRGERAAEIPAETALDALAVDAPWARALRAALGASR